MQLLECIVSKPGLLNNIKFKLDKGITVIYGKNESGKTLIAKAIIDTLFGEFFGQFSLNGKAWDDMHFELLFNNSSNQYRFIKDKKESFIINYADMDQGEYSFSSEKQLFQLPDKERKNINIDGEWFIKLLEAKNDTETAWLFSKIDMQTFLNICYLPEPIDIARKGRLDYKILQKFLMDDKGKFFSLHKNISNAFRNENPGDTAFINHILKNENELKKIEKKIQIAGIHTSKSERLNKEKTRLEDELKNMENGLSDARANKAKLISIHNNLKQLEEIKTAIENKIKEKQAEQEKIDLAIKTEENIKIKYPKFYNFEESNIKNLKKIQESYREVRDVHEEIENFYLLRSEKKNNFKNIILSINISCILILAALFGISNYAFPIAVLDEYKAHFIVGLLAFSIFSSLLLLLYYFLKMRSSDLKRIMKKKSGVEKKLEETLQKNSIILNEYKLEAIYEYLVKYFEEYGEYSINQTELLNIRENLKGNDYIEAFNNEIDKLKTNENEIKQEIDNCIKSFADNSQCDLDMDKTNILILNRNHDIAKLKENIIRTEKILMQIDEELSRGIVQNNELTGLREEQTKLQTALQKLTNYKISFGYINNLLKDAIAKREEKQIAGLARTAAEKFHFITDNQYTDLINENAISKLLKNEMPGEEINNSILYLLYLSVKFALTETVGDFKMNLPMIIDEPFQQMDEERIIRFKKTVDDISLKRQVLIFTHDSKYKDWGLCIEL
ncbi:MAG: hypothetical protein V1874_15410 [Spirochaetota bacterium]